ncbi:putative ammonium transporter 3 [Glandiceps talaboti]
MNVSTSNLLNITEESSTEHDHGEHHILRDDATWILACAFIIFTMQSGFGLLESGSVSSKNEANIMVKNAIDVIFGGMSYWALGYGIGFGSDKHSNPFCGVGNFFVDATDKYVGSLFSDYFFQASFATTATTIVSGAMAERTKLEAYIVFSFLNTFIYSFPCHWIWGSNGWLNKLRVIDIAGSGAVHLVGGTTGLVATLILGPRHRRFEKGQDFSMGNPTNVLLGMFMLWWGWLGFNCGSSYGITGGKWILASRSAVTTINASVGGGAVAILLSYLMKKRKFDIGYLVNGILGALVGVTAICALTSPWAGLVIGIIAGIISCLGAEMMDALKIDDPVGVVPVHFLAAIWGMLAVGFFIEKDSYGHGIEGTGLIYGGGAYMLAVQTLAVVAIISWTSVSSFIVFKLIDLTIGLRLPLSEELLGADIVEHGLRPKFSYPNTPNGNIIDNNDEVFSSKKAHRRLSRVTFKQRKKRRAIREITEQQNVFSIYGKRRGTHECLKLSSPSELRDICTDSTTTEIVNGKDNNCLEDLAAASFINLCNEGFMDDDRITFSGNRGTESTSQHKNDPNNATDSHDRVGDGSILSVDLEMKY